MTGEELFLLLVLRQIKVDTGGKVNHIWVFGLDRDSDSWFYYLQDNFIAIWCGGVSGVRLSNEKQIMKWLEKTDQFISDFTVGIIISRPNSTFIPTSQCFTILAELKKERHYKTIEDHWFMKCKDTFWVLTHFWF